MKIKSHRIEQLVDKALDIMSRIEATKQLYKDLDELILLLKDVPNLEKYGVELRDNFAEKNVVFRPAGVRRFELRRL